MGLNKQPCLSRWTAALGGATPGEIELCSLFALHQTQNVAASQVCLSLATLGIAAYDVWADTGIAAVLIAATVVQGLAGLIIGHLMGGLSLPARTRSMILGGSWMALWLNTLLRLSLAPTHDHALLMAAVLAASGWCLQSTRAFWTAMFVGIPTAWWLGWQSPNATSMAVLPWALPWGVVFGWRMLAYRLWIVAKWDALARRNSGAQDTLRETLRTLRASEERFRLLSETVPVGVFQCDEDGHIIYANTAWRRITDAAAQNSSFFSCWYAYLAEEDRDAIATAWQLSMSNGEPYSDECRLATDQGVERWIQVRARPMYSDAGVSYVGAIEDITQRRLSEAELRRYAANLQEARAHEVENAHHLAGIIEELKRAQQRAEDGTRAKSEFLANMSHEIRTPMNAVLGYADVVLEQTADQPAVQESLRTIKRNAEFLLEIINDILDLSKIEAGRLDIEHVRCSPPQIAQDVLSLMQIRAQEKLLALSFEAIGPIPQTVETDPTRLRQILLNLISNAVKFTPAGAIRLSVKYDPDTVAAGQGTLVLAVTDSGVGMTTEQIARLFRPFTQADTSTTRKFGGTGLGLTICKRFCELMGGQISVTSAPGQGSTFTVSLPVTSATDLIIPAPQVSDLIDETQAVSPPASGLPLSAPESSTRAVADAAPYRILVAEDGLDNQKLFQFMLKKAGATVTMVENGQMAVERALAAESTAEPFDVILMDMQMPVLDGYGATQQLREADYSGPIIALTAHAMSGDREKCLAAGCTDYTTKPINRATLTALIRQHAEAHRNGETCLIGDRT